MLLVVVVVVAVMVPGLVALVVGVMFGGYDVGAVLKMVWRLVY